jgi:hypothetical protein
MKFGVREICDVVLRAKTAQKIGNKIFYKGEPVIYFDSLKTSTMEGAATTVYAQGCRGNSRLVAWEGERTVTFTMEDALISPEGFMILSGAGLVEAKEGAPLYVHITETVSKAAYTPDTQIIYVDKKAYIPVDGSGNRTEDTVYIMPMINGEIYTEPFIAVSCAAGAGEFEGKFALQLNGANKDISELGKADAFLVDYYEEKIGGVKQIEITADKFGGNFYLEASTLFRDTNGIDMPAEFIIPSCKIQSNFTFTMASSGDPSTFTFTMDAFPDYTRFDKTKKVLSLIQIIDESAVERLGTRTDTNHAAAHEDWFVEEY